MCSAWMRTIEKAQRGAFVIYAIFARGADAAARSRARLRDGQASLADLAEKTGGKALFLGLDTPTSFQPYMNQLGEFIAQQYVLTFAISPEGKGHFEHIRLVCETPGVKLVGQEQIFVPAVQQ